MSDSPSRKGRAPMTEISLSYPFEGRWLVQNSPADKVPSHGTERFGTAHSIDFVPVDGSGRSAPVTAMTWLRPEPPEQFVGFGRDILAPCSGRVVATSDGAPDHRAHRGLPSIGYALTQGRRARAGWSALTGNHVVIRAKGTHGGDTVFVVLCHLQQGSVTVEPGQHVGTGDLIGRCGNSGNSTEPHLHVQAVDNLDFARARAVPLTFHGGLPRNGEVVDTE